MEERQQNPQDQPTQQFPQQPAWGAPPAAQGPSTYYPPAAPMQPQPKARPKWKTPLIASVALVVGIVIGAAANGSKSTPSTTAGSTSTTGTTAPSAPAPATSAAAAAPAKPATSTPPAAPAAPAKSVVLTVSGNGIKTTKQFTVADNWSLKYTYDCSSFGSQGNFQVMEQGGDNDGMPLVNELAAKGSDVTYQHSDAGQHSLEVNSECSWTVTVTSGDAG